MKEEKGLKAVLLSTIFALVLLSVAWPCAAQYGSGDGGGASHWDIRAGKVFPRGNTVDSSEYIVGLELEEPTQLSSRNADASLTVTIDYIPMTSRGTPSSAGATVNLLPILLNYKLRTTMFNQSLYFALGAGVYYAQDPIPEMRLPDSRSFAWQVMAGVEVKNGLFLEGRYIAGEHPNDDGLVAAAIGYHY